jgi:peptide/nickel transport system substrate-binding protein
MRPSTWARRSSLLLLPFLAACPGDRAGDGGVVGDPVPGGTAVVAVTSDFQPFNPVTAQALVTMEVINFMLFAPLVRYEEDLGVQPYLAESWDLDDNGVTFRLREGATWHDGQPVTAEDVRFTFDMAKNPETASLLESAFLTMVRSATVVDPRTVRFDFVAPHSQPLEGFVWSPVPSHLLRDVPAAQLAQAPYGREPVGNGPFRFVSWEPGQRVTLEAYDQFPQEMGGRPYLDRMVFRVIPESTTRLTELLTGAVDVNYTVLPDEAQQVQGQRGVETQDYLGREFLYVGWNNEREPFRDPRVRRALGMAINQQALIDALLFGFAQPSNGPIPPWSPMHPEIPPLPHDPQGARQLLMEAGFQDAGGGMLQRGGTPLGFTLLTSENRLRQDIATVLQQQFRQIGADVQIRSMEFQTLLQQHRGRDYEAVLASWSLDNFRVDPSPLFSCDQARQEGSPNRAGYCNPQADQLILAGLGETDQGRARDTWTQFTRILQQDQPISFLYWTEEIGGVGQRVQNVRMDIRSKLANVTQWWIPEDRRR